MAHSKPSPPGGSLKLIGHRGAAAVAPENTLAAIEAGLSAGADGVEVDVRATADGRLVLIHDAELSSTTDGVGTVGAATFEEVRRLDAGFHFSLDGAFPFRGAGLTVPTLADALEAVPPDKRLIVEIKGTPWDPEHDPNEPVARAVARALADAGRDNVTVSSFNPQALAVVRHLIPELRTAVLTARAFDAFSNLHAALEGGHEECHVPLEVIDEAFVARAHGAGRRVVAWTVNDADALRACGGMGVDAAICDDPGAARLALSAS